MGYRAWPVDLDPGRRTQTGKLGGADRTRCGQFRGSSPDRVPDHLGCVAALKNILVAGNWDSKLLYMSILPRCARADRAKPSTTRYQDMKFVDGHLVAGGSLTLGAAPSTGSTALDEAERTLRSGAIGPVRPLAAAALYRRGHGTPRPRAVRRARGWPQSVLHFTLDDLSAL